LIKYSVVIPVLNEESIIQELVDRLVKVMNNLKGNFELVIVDDGSTDSTWFILQNICALNKNIKAISFSRNFGHHVAITAGLHESCGEWVIVMDGDLQDRPELIPKLVEEKEKGFDVVFVSRANRPISFVYKFFQKTFYFVLRILSGTKFDSTLANFSIISREVVEAFKKFPEKARFYASTVKWLGFASTNIKADHGERYGGKTSYTLRKRISLAVDIIISFSDRPLRISIFLGFGLSLTSIFIFIWILFTKFTWGYDVVGWTSLIASIFLIGGSILSILGILGVYIGRIFTEVKNRPLYIINRKINI
jgi:polyisoprenyl-phosphate glycosyltransferase